ncbi:hypothetical protein C1E24_17550 [Pseudoalteromonas phenolica]|uniref:Glutathione S-transferase n=1 Tax=Pseudoalteromonas phenolica TaxID=161398 RepID=A0A5R9PXS3_9GAMM|nr:glutathione S-transferase family protein [Pseudoalteromonas phenolica]TLX45718.1 hypothetical protein C1E24_17550 [Pseudoalteromonas phenolica]
MYTLYHCPITCSTAVLITLEIIGEAHKVEIIDLFQNEQFSEHFLAINPLGKVPVLKTKEYILTQGEAILIHLSQKHPEAALMPDLATTEGADALKWLNFVASTVHGHFSRVFQPERIANEHKVVKANAEEELVKLFTLIEQQLQQQSFLSGSLPTLADYYLAVILGWDRMLSFDLVERFPELKDYKQRLQQAQTNSPTLLSL